LSKSCPCLASNIALRACLGKNRTDRVLYKCRSNDAADAEPSSSSGWAGARTAAAHLSLQYYESVPGLRVSDHRAVRAAFCLSLPSALEDMVRKGTALTWQHVLPPPLLPLERRAPILIDTMMLFGVASTAIGGGGRA
jgi:hypothetical protein